MVPGRGIELTHNMLETRVKILSSVFYPRISPLPRCGCYCTPPAPGGRMEVTQAVWDLNPCACYP